MFSLYILTAYFHVFWKLLIVRRRWLEMNWCQLTNLRKYLKESYFAGTRFANKIIWRHISKTDFCLVIFADSMSKHFAKGSQSWFEVAFQFRIPKIQITISKYVQGNLAFRQETFWYRHFVSMNVFGSCMFWLRRHVAQGCFGMAGVPVGMWM